MQKPIIIIGTGLAAYQLAKEFRKLDTETPLLMVTADEGDFYSKPLLSTAMTSKKTAASLALFNAESMANQLKARIITKTRVTQIDTKTQHIGINQESLAYSKLVLACGADTIKPPLEGDAVNEVISINHLFQYARFQELIQHKKHITILGAGLIGCEFANDLSNAGYEVHLVAPVKAPLDLLVPESIGLLLQSALSENGVHFHLGCIAKRIQKDRNAYRLHLSNGSQILSDLVISAIGLIPHLALAYSAQLETNRGILVNRYLETSEKNIYALGDCAEVEGHVLPYITPLLNCARALAKTLTGSRTAVEYPAMPVIVKTPAHPIAICPPPKGIAGEWKIETNEDGVRALFYDDENQLLGFVLTNEAVKERMALAKTLPHLF